jgi:hypothetical protein
MGFQRSTLKLTFEGEFAGLEVHARRLSVDEALSLAEFADIDKASSEQRKALLARLYDILDHKISGWNYETDNGEPVSINVEQITRLDQGMLFAIVNGLLEATAAVSRPLPKSSSDGVPYPGLNLAMEVASPDPSS